MGRIVLALVAFGLLFAAAPVGAKGLPLGGKFGGELRVALQTAPDMDLLKFEENRLVQELVYDPLTRLGTNQLPVLWVASSATPNAGARTITMDLRPARWPDGAAITAQDVAWSYAKHLAGGTASGFTATAVDADTVRFTFTFGGGDFLGNAATLPIAWKAGSNTATPNGPFVVTAQSGSALDLAANDRHWKGRPFLDRLSFRFPYTLDRNPDGSTRTNDAACALMFGDIHLIGWAISKIELNTERDCVASHAGFPDGVNKTLSDPGRAIPHLGSSLNPALRVLHLGMNTARPPLTDARLRQALSRAIDRDLIAGSIEVGTTIADSLISPANLIWFNASVPKYRVERVVVGTQAVPNLEPVNAFLDAAGYLDRDGDGWRDDPSGTPFAFTLLTLDAQTDPQIAKYLDIVSKFRAVGINVVQEEQPTAELHAIVASDAFDLFVDRQDVRGEPAFLFDLLHSSGSRNAVNLAAPALDTILETARDAFDAAARRQAVLDAQGWIADNVPVAPILHLQSIHSYDKATFEGWVDALGGLVSFWTFTSVHVTQRGPLVVSIDALPSVRSGGATDLLVKVRNSVDDPVEGVDVELNGQGLAATAGVTDAQGMFTTRFTAPPVDVPQDFRFIVNAAAAGYGNASATATVTVHPAVRSLLVAIARGAPSMDSGNTTTVRVLVLDDATAAPVDRATVALSVNPDGLGGRFAQATGVTDSLGAFETNFTAEVTVLSRFLLTATVTMPGYDEARATTSVEVSPLPSGPAPPTPALDTISMVAVVAALAAVYGAWQRRKWRERKP